MIEPTIESETTVHFADHEILLSFNDDVDAEVFFGWWKCYGFTIFEEYFREKELK